MQKGASPWKYSSYWMRTGWTSEGKGKHEAELDILLRERAAWCRATRIEHGLSDSADEMCLLWLTIQDVLGPAKGWQPQEMRTLMWSNALGHEDRFKLIVWLFVNGCDPRFVHHWFILRPNMIKPEDRDPVKLLFRRIAREEKGKKYFAYSMVGKMQMHIDGTVHLNYKCSCGK